MRVFGSIMLYIHFHTEFTLQSTAHCTVLVQYMYIVQYSVQFVYYCRRICTPILFFAIICSFPFTPITSFTSLCTACHSACHLLKHALHCSMHATYFACPSLWSAITCHQLLYMPGTLHSCYSTFQLHCMPTTLYLSYSTVYCTVYMPATLQASYSTRQLLYMPATLHASYSTSQLL